MKTSNQFKDNILTIAIQGRVDSSEAANLQNALNDAQKEFASQADEIIIDASGLEYISSSGLRALLLLRKQFENVRVTECSPEVFNVFKMTGFNRMMTVEKSLDSISLDGLQLVKGMKDVYQLTDETVLKVFPKGTSKADVDREVSLSKTCFQMGVPTPMTFDIVKVGDGFGLITETFSKPATIDPRVLGDMLRDLHEHIIEPDGIIPPAVDRIRGDIKRLRDILGDDAVAKLLQMLSALPDGSCLLHGSFSADNIRLRENEMVFSGLGNAAYGNAILDFAHLYSTLSEKNRGNFFDSLVRSYYDIESEDTKQRNLQNIRIFSIIFEFLKLLGEEPTEEQLSASRDDFYNRVTSKWDELLSHLHFKIDFNEEIRKLERNRFFTDSDVNIDWLANTLGTNRHYVSDYFNKVLHTTFSDYLNTMRLNYAIELIKSRKVPQSQISYSVGFNNDHTFRRLFKQRFGCTPSQYKEE